MSNASQIHYLQSKLDEEQMKVQELFKTVSDLTEKFKKVIAGLDSQNNTLKSENAGLKKEIFAMLMAWGTAQDELKKLKDQLKSR